MSQQENIDQPESKPEDDELQQETSAPEEQPQLISQKKHKRSVNLKAFNRKLGVIGGIALKLGTFVIVLLVLVTVFKQLSFKGYSIQEITVPESFEKSGFNGKMFAVKIQERIDQIKLELQREEGFLGSTRNLELGEYAINNKESDVEVSMVGVGLPVKSLINFIGDAWGLSNSKRVVAFVAHEGNQMTLTICIDGQSPATMRFITDSVSLEVATEALTRMAGDHIVEISNPQMLAWAIFRSKDIDYEKLIRLGKSALSQETDSTNKKYAYNILGISYQAKRDFEKAINYYKDAIRVDPDYIDPYWRLVRALFSINRIEEAKAVNGAMLKLGKQVVPEEKQSNLAFSYAQSMCEYYIRQNNTGALDSAVYWNQQALAIMPPFTQSWRSIATFIRISRDLAISLYAQGREQEGRALEKKIYSMVDENGTEPMLRVFNISNLAKFYAASDNYDSAVIITGQYPTDTTIFSYNTSQAERYGYLRDSKNFYKYLKRSLAKGFRPEQDTLQPYAYFRNELQYKQLLAKYQQ